MLPWGLMKAMIVAQAGGGLWTPLWPARQAPMQLQPSKTSSLYSRLDIVWTHAALGMHIHQALDPATVAQQQSLRLMRLVSLPVKKQYILMVLSH